MLFKSRNALLQKILCISILLPVPAIAGDFYECMNGKIEEHHTCQQGCKSETAECSDPYKSNKCMLRCNIELDKKRVECCQEGGVIPDNRAVSETEIVIQGRESSTSSSSNPRLVKLCQAADCRSRVGDKHIACIEECQQKSKIVRTSTAPERNTLSDNKISCLGRCELDAARDYEGCQK